MNHVAFDHALDAFTEWSANPTPNVEPILDHIFVALVANYLQQGSPAERKLLLRMYEVLEPLQPSSHPAPRRASSAA